VVPCCWRATTDLISRILEDFETRDWGQVDLVLSEFGCSAIDFDSIENRFEFSNACRTRLQSVADRDLEEMADTVLDGAEAAGEDADGVGLWQPEGIRLFVSHLATQRNFAAEVREELRPFGVDAFVAHNDIEVSLEWQAEIERALRTAQALLGLAHPGSSNSWWIQQEIGWALGRRVPIIIVRMGEDPEGFPAKFQWPSMAGRAAADVAGTVGRWIGRRAPFGPILISGLIEALRDAGSYYAAEAAAKRIEALGTLTDAQLDALTDAYLANNQVYGSVLARPVVQRIFQTHGRELPDR
jgi:hypothetical protein